jgi:hypothetical protein
MFRKSFLLAAAVLLVSAVTAMACGDEAASTGVQKASMTTTDAAPQQMTVKGQLVCLGCTLKAEGARSACSEFGCSHALKTADGRMIGFLHNKFSRELISGTTMHDKNVEITGTFFANANMLDVQSYTVEGEATQVWCEGHTAMDACMASH